MKILLIFLLFNSLIFCFNDDEKKAIRDIVKNELSKNENTNFSDEIVIEKISEDILKRTLFIPSTKNKINEQISREIKYRLNDFDIKKEVKSEINKNLTKIINKKTNTTTVDNNGFSFVYNIDQIVQGVREFYDSAWQTLLWMLGVLGATLAFVLNKISKTRVDELEEKLNSTTRTIDATVNNITSNIIALTKESLEAHVKSVAKTNVEDLEIKVNERMKNKQKEHLDNLENLCVDIEKNLNEKFLDLKNDLKEVRLEGTDFESFIWEDDEGENDE